MLQSIEHNKAGGLARAQQLAEGFGDAVVINSNQVPGLRPNYWVVVSPGTFATKKSAQNHCAEYGLAVGVCYGRQVKG